MGMRALLQTQNKRANRSVLLNLALNPISVLGMELSHLLEICFYFGEVMLTGWFEQPQHIRRLKGFCWHEKLSCLVRRAAYYNLTTLMVPAQLDLVGLQACYIVGTRPTAADSPHGGMLDR